MSAVEYHTETLGQLEILKPVLYVCGDHVINLSLVCPQISTMSSTSLS